MTAKEELLIVRNLNKALKTTEREIAQCRADIYALHATDYSKEKLTGGTNSDISDKVARLLDLLKKANQEWDILIRAKIDVKRKIALIDDLVLRAVLIEYYILGNTWEQVCTNMSYSWKHIHRKHSQALKAYALKNDIQ